MLFDAEGEKSKGSTKRLNTFHYEDDSLQKHGSHVF